MAKTLRQRRQTRQYRIRAKISGTELRPRLNVTKSNMHIYAQIIDDSKGITLASASTQSLKLKSNSIENSKKVGAAVAKMAMDKGIKEVVFDRGGYIYHGKVKAVAESAREAGLKF